MGALGGGVWGVRYVVVQAAGDQMCDVGGGGDGGGRGCPTHPQPPPPPNPPPTPRNQLDREKAGLAGESREDVGCGRRRGGGRCLERILYV